MTAGPAPVDPRVRPMTPDDLPAVLRLNARHADQTSPLDAEALAALFALSDVALVGESPDHAFLLGMFEGVPYASANYAWFSQRFARFAYVDRIVVGTAGQRRGLATALYGGLFAAAAESGRDRVCAEVNANPPNPVSDAFHAARGFFVVGEATHSPQKSVRYLTRRLRLTPEQAAQNVGRNPRA